MLGQGADGEVVDDLGRALVDDVDGVGLRVGHVDARGVAAHLGRQHPRARGGVDVERRGAGDDVRAARAARAARGARRPARRARRPRAAGRRPPPRRGPRAPSAAAPPRARAPWRDRWPRCRGAGWSSRRRGRPGRRRCSRAPRRRRARGGPARWPMTRTRWRAGSTLRISSRARVAVGAAGDEQAPAHRGGGGVAQRVRQRGDLARSCARAEGEHRAQRSRRRVAADDVGGRADRHRGRVRHRHRQLAGEPRAPARRDPRDGVDRAAGRAAAEDVDARTQRGGAHVVDRRGQRAHPPRRAGRHAHDVGHRAVGGVEPAGGEDRGSDAGQAGQLHGRRQRARATTRRPTPTVGRGRAVPAAAGEDRDARCRGAAECDPQAVTARATSVATNAPRAARAVMGARAGAGGRARRPAPPRRRLPPARRRSGRRDGPTRSWSPAPTPRRRTRSTRWPSRRA